VALARVRVLELVRVGGGGELVRVRSQITRIVKADTRRQALVELESVTTDEKVWLEMLELAAAARSEAFCTFSSQTFSSVVTDSSSTSACPYPRERHRSA
jgi:hypothetical protein